jgi:hypothetical protein
MRIERGSLVCFRRADFSIHAALALKFEEAAEYAKGHDFDSLAAGWYISPLVDDAARLQFEMTSLCVCLSQSFENADIVFAKRRHGLGGERGDCGYLACEPSVVSKAHARLSLTIVRRACSTLRSVRPEAARRSSVVRY